MLDSLHRVMNTVTRLDNAMAVLSWDQETYMPEGAVQSRAEQLATLSGLRHQHLTSEESQRIGEGARKLAHDLPERQRLVVENFLEEQERSLKLPAEHVERLARATTLGQDAWKRAKDAKNFALFSDALSEITELKKSEAELLGYEGHPYNAMLDIYEPGLTVDHLNPVFDALGSGIKSLLARIEPRSATVSDEVLFRTYDGQQQLKLATEIIQKLGFSMSTGRVDLSAHPFCTQFDRTDVRLTTRIREHDLRSCLFGLIHESGHGMYEQGVDDSLSGTLSAQGASMGIHESQSLFWENIVARSEEFWHWAFPRVKDAFPSQMSDQTPESFFKAINCIKPSLNRVESDEVTYNLHIILRFGLERDLMDGSLRVNDIPAAWNAKMNELLGVVPASDDEGCLQDVHWSFGGIGYFPSYTLGKLYSAMLWNAMKRELPNAADSISNGEFAPILEWLRKNIHQYGKTEKPDQIIQRVCHSPLTEVDFLEYVTKKAARVYGI